MLMDRMSEPIASCRGVTPTDRPSTVTEAPGSAVSSLTSAIFAGAGTSTRLWRSSAMTTASAMAQNASATTANRR